ncbi:MAG TPA: apolipoprotein N-acyltransferase [Polyangiaceae bacterium]
MSKRTKLPLDLWTALGAAVVSGLFYFLAFAGVDIWPLAFVAFVPLFVALEGQTPKRALWLGVVAGGTMNLAGFYWLVGMLKTFSGFPTVICLFFAAIVCAYQGGRIGTMTWLYARAQSRGWPKAPVAIFAFATSELLYPLLFPWYFAATVHTVPALTQTADLGGPILVGIVLLGVNLAIVELVVARMKASTPNRRVVIGGGVGVALALVYGAIRIHMVDAACATAEQVRVGVVQANMDLLGKRHDPGEGLRRHTKLTQELKAKGVDFVVWSESSVTYATQEKQAAYFMQNNVAGKMGIPMVFGAVLYRKGEDRTRFFNTALSTDKDGKLTARYDKHYLLAFGEYLPLGDTFPILYDWSPNSGKFSVGDTLDPLLVQTATGMHKVGMLICYEDILPTFTNAEVNASKPEMLVNMTNDAWFGDTLEPWQHLALAELRAIEHRRYLVRGTNSGVSAVVDPVGRVIAQSHPFRTEAIDASVRWLQLHTVYETVGEIPWYLMAAAVVAGCFVRRKSSTPAPEKPAPEPKKPEPAADEASTEKDAASE